MREAGKMKNEAGAVELSPELRRKILLSLAGSISSRSADSLRRTLRKLRKHWR
jgi:hypothetical protein